MLKYLFEGFRSIGQGMYDIAQGMADTFSFGGTAKQKKPKTAKQLLKEAQDGWKKDAEAIRGDWEKIIGKWNK